MSFNPFLALIPLAVKSLKYVIDDNFRDKVQPQPGSVLYSDLYVGAEHSGIYIGESKISNIVVDGFAEAEVKVSTPSDFTDSGKLHRKIYVSCNKEGSVGRQVVSDCAAHNIGQRSFYGLMISNCHQFSEKCVNQAQSKGNKGLLDTLIDGAFDLFSVDESWEPTMRSLKNAAKHRLGATKWLLWDWQNDKSDYGGESSSGSGGGPATEPNINELLTNLDKTPLDQESIEVVEQASAELEAYLQEISDESIPPNEIQPLLQYKSNLQKIEEKYQESKDFIEQMGQGLSFNQLSTINSSDFSQLAQELQSNESIKKLVKKLGRNYISPEKKETVCKRMKSEVHGIHKSDEITRLLPSELAGFENEELEYLFYATLLEHNLLTYELSGSDSTVDEQKMKGPVVACLDTSGSMTGTPILKAKALLFAVNKILEPEGREMYVLLFGANNQIEELKVGGKGSTGDLLLFLSKGFNGGTDFETPLARSVEIIGKQKTFENADILMITDGHCSISDSYSKQLTKDKQRLGFTVYTVICNGSGIEDQFSDEALGI